MASGIILATLLGNLIADSRLTLFQGYATITDVHKCKENTVGRRRNPAVMIVSIIKEILE
jgi:hypothetical protein